MRCITLRHRRLTDPLAYDIFGLTWAKEPIQCIAGLTAAIIS